MKKNKQNDNLNHIIETFIKDYRECIEFLEEPKEEDEQEDQE